MLINCYGLVSDISNFFSLYSLFGCILTPRLVLVKIFVQDEIINFKNNNIVGDLAKNGLFIMVLNLIFNRLIMN